MRIQELLEGKKFDDLDFVTKENGKRSINFDLAEDLIHFMNQDDDVYRRHTYPAIANCLDKMSKKSKPNTNVFESHQLLLFVRARVEHTCLRKAPLQYSDVIGGNA